MIWGAFKQLNSEIKFQFFKRISNNFKIFDIKSSSNAENGPIAAVGATECDKCIPRAEMIAAVVVYYFAIPLTKHHSKNN